MRYEALVWGEGLPTWVTVTVGVLVVLYFARAIADFRAKTSRSRWIAVTDVAAGLLVVGAVLRPTIVTAVSTPFGPRVAVLVDGSRRLGVRSGSTSRAEDAARSLKDVESHFTEARIGAFEFGNGPLRPIRRDPGGDAERRNASRDGTSDLVEAFEQLEGLLGEKPAAIVVISDGRFSRPLANAEREAFVVPSALRGTVVHAVDVGGEALPDASLVSVATTGSAVAHQPLSVEIVVGCFGGLACSRVPISIREFKMGMDAVTLARGEAVFSGQDTARLSLEITLERAGTRVIEVGISPPEGDSVAENDVRLLPIEVVRDRLRLLHVAGRPTYDVRALRNWLKRGSSVDLVSFFILRTDSDDTNVDEDAELALIPFPVDELFDEHLSSFDAVLLGDIDADRYRLSRYLGNLARFVEQGGGLILVGGPSAFAGGAYASSPIERILPIGLVNSERPFDTVEFVPRTTNAGKTASLLSPLRNLVGDALPSMPGANSFGIPRGRAVVLWEHPSRTVLPLKTGGAPGAMPVLAVSEVGDGRVVALGIDGTHRLAFGLDAVQSGGRAFGALWDGLLGWVIRDPRFESAHGEVVGECIAAEPTRVRIVLGGKIRGDLLIEAQRLEAGAKSPVTRRVQLKDESTAEVDLGLLATGAYSALARIGDEPAARFDFACELGGPAWADTRPDPKRLVTLVEANRGKRVRRSDIDSLPKPTATLVHGSRQARPLLGTWLWATLLASCLALNWLLRRADGLT